MIPKVIHYCWFGHGKLPKSANRCLLSWQKHFPGYEIKEWNEDNFDINIIPYTCDAYKAKKYAFVSDYARFWILYNYGGIYFDTDVEVIEPMDKMIANGAFMGAETSVERGERLYVAPGLGIASEPHHPFIKECLDLYNNLVFKYEKGQWTKTICEYVTELLEKHGLKQTDEIQSIAGLTIYPWDYMCPISTEGHIMRKTTNTVSIHYFAATWKSPWQRFKKQIGSFLGSKLTCFIIKIKKSCISKN